MGFFAMFTELCVTPGIMLSQQDDRSESLKFIFPGLTATLFKFIFPGDFLSRRLLTESKFGINGIQANSLQNMTTHSYFFYFSQADGRSRQTCLS